MTDENRPFDKSSELDPPIESAVWSVVSAPIDMAAVERVKARAEALSSHAAERVRAADASRPHRRRVMTLMSLAAGLLLAVGALLLVPSSSTAFAQVIEQLKAAGAFRYTELIHTTQQAAPIEVTVLVADDGRQRIESPTSISLMNATGGLELTLIKASRTAIVAQGAGAPQGQAMNQLAWLEQLKAHGDKPDRKLGAKTLDGRDVEGFVAKQGEHEFTIWTDAQTNDLVQIEFDGMIEGSPIQKVVMKEFRFNETFDESLFSFKVPEGYQARQLAAAPALLPGEESLIEALRGYTRLTDGKFPKSLADWGEWAVLASKSGASPEETAAIMTRLGAVTPFLFSMSKNDYEYLGAGKTTGGDRTIVFWRRTESGEIRAIYNDLSAAVVDETELLKGN